MKATLLKIYTYISMEAYPFSIEMSFAFVRCEHTSITGAASELYLIAGKEGISLFFLDAYHIVFILVLS